MADASFSLSNAFSLNSDYAFDPARPESWAAVDARARATRAANSMVGRARRVLSNLFSARRYNASIQLLNTRTWCDQVEREMQGVPPDCMW